MKRDPFSCKYPLKINRLNMCEYIPLIHLQVEAPSGSNGNDHQLFKNFKGDCNWYYGCILSTDTATAIDTASAT
jgi:hypothetical protein